MTGRTKLFITDECTIAVVELLLAWDVRVLALDGYKFIAIPSIAHRYNHISHNQP